MNNVAAKALDVADKANEFIPLIQVIGESFADSAKIFTYFSYIATAAGDLYEHRSDLPRDQSPSAYRRLSQGHGNQPCSLDSSYCTERLSAIRL